MTDTLTEIAEWLRAVGYPFDWSAPDHPLPEPLRRPLTEAWRGDDLTVSFDEWEGTLRVEGAW
jgi:hypothetical protein